MKTKKTIDADFITLNEVVKNIDDKHILEEVHQKYPGTTNQRVNVRVLKVKSHSRIFGKVDEKFSLLDQLSTNHEETKAKEAKKSFCFIKDYMFKF